MRNASEALGELNGRMLLRLLSINPDCATVFGRHDPYDAHLPHGGFQRIRDNLDLLDEWGKKSDEIVSSGDLSKEEEVSLRVLDYTRKTYRFVVDDYPLWRMQPDALENVGTAMLMTLVRDYAPLALRLESMSARIGELPRYLGQFRERFAGAKAVRMWTEAALQSCNAFPGFLDTVQNLSSSKVSSRSHSEMTRTIAVAKDELTAHEAWLRKILDSSTDKFAMGRKSYVKLMRIRGIPYNPDELVGLATRYLEDFKEQRVSIASKISGSSSPEDARSAVGSESPASIEEVVEITKAVVEKARDFVLARDLVTIPGGSKVLVMKAPEILEGSLSSAATYLPAVFEQSQDTVFLISGVEGQERLKAMWNYSAIDSTAVHEAYPGHHLQGVKSNKKPWMHQLPHFIYSPEALSPPYESQEGWATYCESMMHDKGFLGSDEHAFGSLDYFIGNACRMISEVKLACEDATIEEMIDMTAMETGCSRAIAEQGVKSFTRMPGYGMCYLSGWHLVNSLKNDLMNGMGRRFSEKRFHDLVAENGNLPFYLLESEVRSGMAADATDESRFV
jgi:hypothetical protein